MVGGAPQNWQNKPILYQQHILDLHLRDMPVFIIDGLLFVNVKHTSPVVQHFF